MKNKQLILVLSLILAASMITGCGRRSDETTPTSSPGDEQTEPGETTLEDPLPTPKPSTSPSAGPETTKTAAETTRATYIVQAGDSWWSIAMALNVDMNALAELNGRTTADVVQAGEELLLPAIDETAATTSGTTTTATESTTASPSVDQEPMSGTRYTTDYLNLRRSPGTAGEQILIIPPGEAVSLLAHVPSSGWYQVTYDGKTGYVNGNWLSETRPETTTTTAASGQNTPDGRTGSQLDTPYTSNGITLVNKQHWVSRNYVPSVVSAGNNAWLAPSANDAWTQLRNAAAAAGHSFTINNGYRSYDLQETLYENYAAQDGYEAANRYSAKPGQSEHQTGLAMDIVDDRGWAGKDSLNERASGQWLRQHAREYGWIMRYPQGKESETGYRYEPWHYRYVGVEAATYIEANGLTLEAYLGE